MTGAHHAHVDADRHAQVVLSSVVIAAEVPWCATSTHARPARAVRQVARRGGARRPGRGRRRRRRSTRRPRDDGAARCRSHGEPNCQSTVTSSPRWGANPSLGRVVPRRLPVRPWRKNLHARGEVAELAEAPCDGATGPCHRRTERRAGSSARPGRRPSAPRGRRRVARGGDGEAHREWACNATRGAPPGGRGMFATASAGRRGRRDLEVGELVVTTRGEGGEHRGEVRGVFRRACEVHSPRGAERSPGGGPGRRARRRRAHMTGSR